MEKLTYNPIRIHFFCVQPIQIENDCLTQLFKIKPDRTVLKTAKSQRNPSWFNLFNNDLYQSILPIDIEPLIDNDILKNEIQTNFKVDNYYALTDYLNTEKTHYYLLFDQRLVYFNLIYELVFEVDLNFVEELSKPYPNRLDFYNTVRKILVGEDQDAQESNWARRIKTTVIGRIKNLLETAYKTRIDQESVFIEPSTGNITAFIQLDELDKNSKATQINQRFIELNNTAERLQTNEPPIVLNKTPENLTSQSEVFGHELYHFNGRFHTIVHKIETDKHRYMPIQFHMQFMWFYLKKINLILENNYNDLLFCETFKSIETHTDNTDNLINKIETLIMHNEKFKLTIESDNERIYQKIQGRWNIENLLANSNRYINYFKEHLNSLFAQKSSKAEQRQNSILLFITLFQFIALISVWNDYLALLKDDVVTEAEELTNSLITPDLLHEINVFLPIGFLVIIFILLVYVFKKAD